ncbi:MAG: ComF family protein [Elusimicrobiota bacterium]|nr:ComF family protein [Elusimicrobiota bacterium]
MKKILLHLLGFIFPVTCSLCGKVLSSVSSQRICQDCQNELLKVEGDICIKCGDKPSREGTFCKTCQNDLNFFAFDKLRAVFKYNDKIRKLILQFKYSNRVFLADFFASSIYQAFKDDELFFNCDIVLGVPISFIRRAHRGYNQAELVAKKLAKLINKPHCPKILFRKKITKAQFKLSKKERQKNLLNSFWAKNSPEIKDKSVLLIDDIATTATTASACAAELKRAGAKYVFVLVIARK